MRIIDYPKNRALLIKEFNSIADNDSFRESVNKVSRELECEKIWWERHNDRAKVFLSEIKQLMKKRGVIFTTEPGFALIYEDPHVPDVNYEICPEIVKEYF
jgi:hypothetical protein